MDNWDELAQKLNDNQYKTKFVKSAGAITKLKARRDNVVITVICETSQRHWSVEVRTISKDGITMMRDYIANMKTYWPGGKTHACDTPLLAVEKAIGLGDQYHDDYEINHKVYKRSSKNFTPFTFNDNVIRFEFGKAQLDSIMHSCAVIAVVGITDDGKLDNDILTKPDEKPWFYFVCHTHVQARFYIISDGVSWHPINRKTEKLTSVMGIKADQADMSALDLALITNAITNHIA